jgi:hypothetical protein
MSSEESDRFAIRQLVDEWIIFSDGGDWERFRSLWHDDGHMIATWTAGSGHDFVEMRRKAFERGPNGTILHFNGGHTAQIVGNRAIGQTKMHIYQRAEVHGVLCDVVCVGRFYDFLEKRNGRWGFVHRQCIYEKDRLDSVVPGKYPELDQELLMSFPEGYRHLAYMQCQLGHPVKKSMPGLRDGGVELLLARGKAWLAGAEGHPRDIQVAPEAVGA